MTLPRTAFPLAAFLALFVRLVLSLWKSTDRPSEVTFSDAFLENWKGFSADRSKADHWGS